MIDILIRGGDSIGIEAGYWGFFYGALGVTFLLQKGSLEAIHSSATKCSRGKTHK